MRQLEAEEKKSSFFKTRAVDGGRQSQDLQPSHQKSLCVNLWKPVEIHMSLQNHNKRLCVNTVEIDVTFMKVNVCE